jgi:pullulanase/glycogen debranching enzyme
MRAGSSIRHRGLRLFFAIGLALVAGCGGGGGSAPAAAPSTTTSDPALAIGDSPDFQFVLNAVPALASGGGSTGAAATALTVHYQRSDGVYTGWQLHAWGAATDPGWGLGYNSSGSDSFGAIYELPLAATTGAVGYLFHNGDNKDHGGVDQSYTLVGGKNEIWRIQNDNQTYRSNPTGALAPDIATVRVHYQRFRNDYSAWGLHLWDGGALATARLPGAVRIDNWSAAVPFAALPGYAASSTEVVFDLPVVNPRTHAGAPALEFIIHGQSPNEGDQDGRSSNIRIDYAALTISNQVGEVWLQQHDAQVYAAAPDFSAASTTDARAYWLSRQLIQWPRVDSSGTFRLYHSATGQIVAARGARISGADGEISLAVSTAALPSELATRFKFVNPGVIVAVRDADLALLPGLLREQLVVVQEDASGRIVNATTAQLPGALDDWYAAAGGVDDLGVRIFGASTRFKLWAPTAQKVSVYTYDSGVGAALSVDAMAMDPATGVWTATRAGDLSGRYYRFGVEVFVRGTGVVRNLVTDAYSVSLSANSQRSYIADLSAASLKPAGWDAHATPTTVTTNTDLVIYELHVRDFSINDFSVSAARRGKYGAFTESAANGMVQLKGLAAAGLTDVHLLPVFDIATIPETGCTTPSPTGASDSPAQQALVSATASGDCFNWGYDPWHYNAPEGSYASDAADGARRIVEFRQMVQALHGAGLRVGMDLVYNHTAASGQKEKSVLDRIVPGYYHRLNASGVVETSTCCDNTAAENRMMAKLVIDSALVWARDYRIDSFRFDVMAHLPRSVLEALQSRVDSATGRHIALIGEGWSFGEVANDARFVQASQLGLNGSGIGTFSDRARDAVRGGSPFDSGNSLVANQGYVNGLFVDSNPLAGAKTRNDLMWAGDLIKAGLAGSIRTFPLTTSWDATLALQDISVNGGPAGYVLQPAEVVNYVENHDGTTLFDNNVYKLPVTTSSAERARVQILAAATVAFSQGIAYFHAGIDSLRSKSLDRNSYDSGDWFNRLDWAYGDNNFGVGLPPSPANSASWSVMQPLLANGAIKPAAADIAWTRDAFRDLLRIRASTTLLRLRSAADIESRLRFYNTGSTQEASLLAAHLDGKGYAGAGFQELVYLINVDKRAHELSVAALAGRAFELHPVHRAAAAADQRIAGEARFDPVSGSFSVPARSAVVFVVR